MSRRRPERHLVPDTCVDPPSDKRHFMQEGNLFETELLNSVGTRTAGDDDWVLTPDRPPEPAKGLTVDALASAASIIENAFLPDDVTGRRKADPTFWCATGLDTCHSTSNLSAP